jgi:DNA-binding MurR/RpiR family transcriptional regulator
MISSESPMSFAAFRALLSARRDQLPPRLRQIAEYVALHSDEVAFSTVADIARHAGVQPSSIVRFAHALGLAGYSELQAICQHRLRGSEHAARLDRLRASTPAGQGQLVAGFVSAALASLQKIDAQQADADVARAAAFLSQVETLHILGLRRMFSVASYMAYVLPSLGVRARLIDRSGGLEPETAKDFGPRDGLIVISFRPYASATLAIAEVAKEAGIPIVAITDSPLSPLVPLAGQSLEVAEADFAGFRSLAATMTIASALMARIAEERGIKPN